MPQPEIDPITADVLHSAVHDLYGPANRVRVLAQLIGQSGVLDDDTRGLLSHIEDCAAAVRTVAEGLRAYSEICARVPHPGPVALDRSLQSAIADLRSEIESAQAQISSAPLPEVEGDPFLLTWLVRELLANAIRFRGADAPQVRVAAGQGGPGGWFVSVADNGPGIEESLAERVFRPFKKLVPGAGAGLGLTICRKIVERHQGQIWVEPKSRGADVRFFIGGGGRA